MEIPWPAPYVLPARQWRSDSENAEPQPWQAFGAGCQPLGHLGKAAQLRALSNRSFNTASLPTESKAFVCYSGALAAEVEASPKQWKDPGFADNAVVLVEDFLTGVEVEHLKSLVLGHAKVYGTDRSVRQAYAGGAQYGGNMVSGHPQLDVSLPQDEILNAVEKRIATALGIPASNEESHLQMMMSVGRPEILGVENKMQAIHHDKNSGLTRQATAIIYVSPVEGDGGETVFPALPVHPSGPVPRTPEMRKIGQELKKFVKGKLDHLEPSVPWPPLSVDEDTSPELHAMMATACPAEGTHRPSAGNKTAPLIVKPVPGRAIFFWHETRRKGNALFDSFHMGCAVKRGVKLALQKFKHFAAQESGCQKSKWCRVGMARAEEYARIRKAITTD